MELSDRQRVDAVRALELLAPYGATLTQAATSFVERTKLLSRTVSFRELGEQLIVAKKADRKSPRYTCDLKHRLKTLGKVFGERPVATIEAVELDDWLRALKQSPTSRVNFRKVLHVLFEFAITRGYAKDNPVVRTAKVKAEHAAPGILTPAEIGALLGNAEATIVPWLAIAAFAGLREAEIGRLTWDKVDLVGGHIKVDASIAKTQSRRIIPISANLSAWLAPYARKSGLVRPSRNSAIAKMREARVEASKALRLNGTASTNLTNWPNNALRHSFASYRLALTGNAAQTAEEAGHSVFVLKAHYRELVTKREAEAWFAVCPSPVTENVIAISKQA